MYKKFRRIFQSIILGTLIILSISGRASCLGKSKNNNQNTGVGSSPSTFNIPPPSNLNVTVISSDRIDLFWEDNSNNEDGFEIERSTSLSTGYSLLATVSANTTSYSDSGLISAITYYYRIRAFNTIGDRSDWSNIVSAFAFNWALVPVVWTGIAAGGNHSLALASNDRLWSWGSNSAGQLGLGDWNNNRIVPNLIKSDDAWNLFENIRMVVANTDLQGYSFTLKTDNTLWAWGINGYGQLGIGETNSPLAPLQVGSNSDWSMITAGFSHSLGLKTAGTLWVWGRNDRGQLGLGDVGDGTERITPTQLTTGTDWFSIAAGNFYSLALKTNGTLWGWGENYTLSPSQIGTASDWVKMAAGYYHSITLKTDNTIWSWGNNDYGQLGLGDSGATTYRNTPTQVTTETDWLVMSGTNLSTITAGGSHTLGLRNNRTLWAWGKNNADQLGLGDGIDRNTPTQVGTDMNWSIIKAGGSHNLGIKTDGTLWVWGSTDDGRLGLGVVEYSGSRNMPCRLGSPNPPSGLNAIAVSSAQINLFWIDRSSTETGFKIERSTSTATGYSLLATISANTVSYSDSTVSFGLPYYYRLKSYTDYGDSPYSNISSATPTVFAPSLLNINIISPTQIQLSWQDNSPDEMGFIIERSFGGKEAYTEIGAVGSNIAIYFDTTITPGNIYYYRVRGYNSLGYGVYSIETTTPAPNSPSGLTYSIVYPTQINLFWQDNSSDEYSFKIERKISAYGTYQQIATLNPNVLSYSDTIVTQGNCYCYRVGAFNVFLIPNYSNIIEVPFGIELGGWVKVVAGYAHSLGLYSNGTLWTWGDNLDGQLGLGDMTNRNIPIEISSEIDWLVITGTNSSTIAAGSSHSLAIKTNRTLWVWGGNYSGQLGLGITDFIKCLTPSQINTDSDWSQIAARTAHTIGIRTNRTLWAWGQNNYGQLGDNSTTIRYSPRKIGIDSDWVALSAGDYHSLGIRTNGSIWAWGANWHGQLGLGNSIEKHIPTQIGSATDWSDITAGISDTLALKTNGTLWAWGWNNDGQLGLGDSGIDRNTPTQLGTGSDWTTLAAGYYHTFGFKTNGILWSWGKNQYGQLGLGDTTNRNIPTQVITDTGWITITGGQYYNLGIKSNGTLWAWGNNGYGNLGLGDTINRNVPCPLGSPAPPSSLTADGISYSQINLSWIDNSFNEEAFRIERSSTSTNGYSLLVTISANTNSYSNTGLTFGNTYYYRVKAYNSYGDSPYSNERSATTGVITFTYTSAVQTWIVPNGVNSIQVDARGGGGEGYGARVKTTITVTPGTILYIYVGGQGGYTAGFNGGGLGGAGYDGSNGDGGGGASDIRQGGTAISNRVVVAGGGGGGSWWGDGGAGGYPNGGDGISGGGGGTQSAGGTGQGNGESGTLGIGGNGGGTESGYNGGGGGGGSEGGGGGGGSSYSSPTNTNTTYTSGYQSGNGQIIISY
jgi:alpha-tubulin suppressor-like RCC1 family protein